MKHSEETIELMKRVKGRGLNIWAMLYMFKKRSKLSEELPDEVVKAVCLEYLNRGQFINNSFPYFLQVLKRISHDYFANRNVLEHTRIKNEPLAIKNIFKMLANQ